MGKRMNIALYISMFENEFSYAVCEGAFLGAKEIDANLFILPAGIKDAVYDDYDANCYRYQYNTLYSLTKTHGFDAIIIEYGSITSFLNEKEKRKFLKSLGHNTPIILLAGEEKGYSSVAINNKAGLEEVIVHLIEHHKCTKIGFVSGPIETNQDARERLDVYTQTMDMHGLECTDDWVVYGNFSEFCEEEVETLLERHPDVEAIVCANDQMAIGVYNVLEKHGLVPGKDVLVTGFDNSPAAMLLEPHLTTVKADIKELAYRAMMECAKVVDKNEVKAYVDSKILTHSSCGCGTNINYEAEGEAMAKEIRRGNVEQVASKVFDRYFNFFFESEHTIEMRQAVKDYFLYFFGLVNEDGVLDINEEEFIGVYNRFFKTYEDGYIDLNNFLNLSFTMQECMDRILTREKDRLLLSRFMTNVNQNLMSAMMTKKIANDEKSKIFEIVLTNITRDMLQFSGEEKKKYYTVIEKLRRMEAESGYLFEYDEGIVHKDGEKWQPPETINLKAYYNRNRMFLYDDNEKKVDFNNMFTQAYIPSDRRFNMLVTPLYSGETQYGMMFIETDLDKYRYASQLACQISVSMEVLDMIKKQNALKLELEESLAQSVANNKILDEISKSDPLTGIYNRRGFLDRVKTVMEAEVYQGRKALVVYADMDNLKIINDEFGHDDGDFALKTIGKAIAQSFRQSDVVARMGGDEFAAFALIAEDNFGDVIKDRIRTYLREMNSSSDKPYLVNISIGTYEFVIGKETNIDQILNKADAELYKEKKSKNKVLYKEGYKKS
ncbi:MAG: GGDEF domain-containing protein [Lachnospiraceae bacterium]|nr:GGDEF domain-containing protein [Lachnospiraceae bacterium]